MFECLQGNEQTQTHQVLVGKTDVVLLCHRTSAALASLTPNGNSEIYVKVCVMVNWCRTSIFMLFTLWAKQFINKNFPFIKAEIYPNLSKKMQHLWASMYADLSHFFTLFVNFKLLYLSSYLLSFWCPSLIKCTWKNKNVSLVLWIWVTWKKCSFPVIHSKTLNKKCTPFS